MITFDWNILWFSSILIVLKLKMWMGVLVKNVDLAPYVRYVKEFTLSKCKIVASVEFIIYFDLCWSCLFCTVFFKRAVVNREGINFKCSMFKMWTNMSCQKFWKWVFRPHRYLWERAKIEKSELSFCYGKNVFTVT